MHGRRGKGGGGGEEEGGGGGGGEGGGKGGEGGRGGRGGGRWLLTISALTWPIRGRRRLVGDIIDADRLPEQRRRRPAHAGRVDPRRTPRSARDSGADAGARRSRRQRPVPRDRGARPAFKRRRRPRALPQIAERRDFFLAFPAIHALARFGDPASLRGWCRCSATSCCAAPWPRRSASSATISSRRRLPPAGPSRTRRRRSIADALAALYDRYEGRYGAGEQIATIVRRTISRPGRRIFWTPSTASAPIACAGSRGCLGWLDGQAVQRALTRLLGQPTVAGAGRRGAGPLRRRRRRSADRAAARPRISTPDRRRRWRWGGSATAGPRRRWSRALDDPELAVPAAGALAPIGDGAAFDALLALVGDPDPAVRQATSRALNSIGHPRCRSASWRCSTIPSPLVRESAVRIAGYFGYPECAGSRDRAMLGRVGVGPAGGRRASCRCSRIPDAVPRSVRALARDSRAGSRRRRGRRSRASTSAQALEPLMQALNDADPWVRYFALRSTRLVREPDARAGGPAIGLERDPAGHVRLVAIDVLGRLQPPDIVSVLEPLTVIGRAGHRAGGDSSRWVTSGMPERSRRSRLWLRAHEPWRRLEASTRLARAAAWMRRRPRSGLAAADDDDVARRGDRGAGASARGERRRQRAARRSRLAGAHRRTVDDGRPSIAALARLPFRRIGDVARGLRHPSPAVRRATVEALEPDATSRGIRSPSRARSTTPLPAVRAIAVAELRRLGSRAATKKLLMLARTRSGCGSAPGRP